MKALDKERDRRYQTASALAADVQRYLHDEPVEACPPSAWYRLGKLARRHKTAMTVIAVVLLAALFAVGSFAVSYRRIDESLQQERQAKAKLVQALYYQRIASAASARIHEQAGRAEELLDQCPDELRGWEWHYLKRLPFDDFPVLHHAGIITMLAVSPDGRLLAAANANRGKGTVKIWDLQTRTVLRELPTHRGFIRLVAFSPDSRLVATASAAGDLKIWDPFTGVLRKDLSSPSSLLVALTFSPDGRCLAAASHDDGVHLWEVESWRPLDPVPQQRVAYNGLAFGRDGRSLVAANREGIVTTYDIATAQALSSFQGHIQQAWAAAFSHDRRLVALGSEDGTIKVWETDSGKELHSLEAHSGLVAGLAFLDGERRLAFCGDDRTLKVWDLATEHEALQLGVFTKRSQGLAVSPDGLRLFYRHPAETEAGDIIGIADGTPLTGRVQPASARSYRADG
jgi:hypothetical protein